MPIRDQSRFKKQEVELRLFNSLKWLRPVLYLVGPNGWKAARKIKEVLKEQLPPLEEQFVRLRNLPDRFNETFLHVGWIATDEMNPDVMEEAIRIYSENGLEAAEVYLEAYYNKEWELYLKRFCFLPRIAPRTQLIELAIETARRRF